MGIEIEQLESELKEAKVKISNLENYIEIEYLKNKELNKEREKLKLENKYLRNEIIVVKRQRRIILERLREDNKNLKLRLQMAEANKRKGK